MISANSIMIGNVEVKGQSNSDEAGRTPPCRRRAAAPAITDHRREGGAAAVAGHRAAAEALRRLALNVQTHALQQMEPHNHRQRGQHDGARGRRRAQRTERYQVVWRKPPPVSRPRPARR